MTERGLPPVDGAPACPFVAFGDDRESRSTSPDHRHRCFAESPPAPRALAHQEAYCLSSAFPVCPTFQEWARREAARALASGRDAAAPTTASDAGSALGAAGVAGAAMAAAADDGTPPTPPIEPESPPRRNPPRDWAAPPPWATGAGAAAAPTGATAAGGPRATERGVDPGPATAPGAPDFLAGRTGEGAGLAGSAADRLATGQPVAPLTPERASVETGPVAETRSPGGGVAPVDATALAAAAAASGGGAQSFHVPASGADEDLADLVSSRPPADQPQGRPSPAPTTGRRPAVSSTRPPKDAIPGPAWERMRRYEAYPTIKTRTGLPGLPRVAILAGAVGIAALALFFLPALLGVGGGGGGPAGSAGASPIGSAAVASANSSPTAPPAPTPQIYLIKAGDTLSKVAKKFGITLDVLLAANKTTIKDPNKISIGDPVTIPVPPPDEFTDPSPSPSPSG